jgi:hypothetical protein
MGIEFAFGLVGLIGGLWIAINALRQVKRDIERD